MRRNAIFIDTWGWLTMADPSEPHYSTVSSFYRGIQTQRLPVYTSNYILSELITLVFRRTSFDRASNFVQGLLDSATRGQIDIETVTSDRFQAAWDLRRRFQDKPRISFTDLTSMVIMRELGINSVLTQDEHSIQVGMGFTRVP